MKPAYLRNVVQEQVAPVRSATESAGSGGDRATEAWQLMTALFADRKEQFPAIAASVGLNPGAMHALMSLDPDEPKSMGVLADAWKCDASNVTWLVDRLEERGLAERRAHPTDRRVRTVVLTRKGVKTRASVLAMLHEPPEAIRALSPTELATLCELLRKVVPASGSAA